LQHNPTGLVVRLNGQGLIRAKAQGEEMSADRLKELDERMAALFRDAN
jgi:hypothetical protein